MLRMNLATISSFLRWKYNVLEGLLKKYFKNYSKIKSFTLIGPPFYKAIGGPIVFSGTQNSPLSSFTPMTLPRAPLTKESLMSRFLTSITLDPILNSKTSIRFVSLFIPFQCSWLLICMFSEIKIVHESEAFII